MAFAYPLPSRLRRRISRFFWAHPIVGPAPVFKGTGIDPVTGEAFRVYHNPRLRNSYAV